jgi:hypothetical protein
MRFVCVVELHCTVSKIRILNAVQSYCMANLYNARQFHPILNKFEIYQQIFVTVFSTKCYGNPSSGSGDDTDGRTHMAKLLNTFVAIMRAFLGSSIFFY